MLNEINLNCDENAPLVFKSMISAAAPLITHVMTRFRYTFIAITGVYCTFIHKGLI